jgi:hypothetical protein
MWRANEKKGKLLKQGHLTSCKKKSPDLTALGSNTNFGSTGQPWLC